VRSEVLSSGEAAKLLGVTRGAVGRLCADGVLADAFVTGGRHWRIPRASVLALLPAPPVADQPVPVKGPYIYLLEAPSLGLVKIGTATNVKQRIAGLRTMLPIDVELVAVFDGGLAEERQLHQRFAQHRVRGEWFASEPVKAALCSEAVGGGASCR